MTLTTPYSATFYVGDGETKTFPYLFEEVSESFISVIVYNSLTGQSSTPTYIVDTDQKQVIFGDDTPAPTADETVCIYRNTPNVQDTPFRTLQGYDAKALENILSKIVAMIQEIKSNYFTTQVLQGDPWQLDLLKASDDGATVNIDYTAKKLVKGLYFQIADGNLQVSADDSNYITMPKSVDVAEFRQKEVILPDLSVVYKLEYRVGNTWYDAGGVAESKAEQALETAEEARDIANEAKDVADEAKEIAEGIDGKAQQALDNSVEALETAEEAKEMIQNQIIVRSATIPTASADLVGKAYQYAGTTNGVYTHNYIYECQEIETNSYGWVRADVQPNHEAQILALQADISDIEALIPAQATPQNQLGDKAFINSSIATNTANFIGTFNSVAELEAYTGTVTNNDYAFVIGTDSAGNTTYNRYKYNANTQQWIYEYTLNNSSFTADQWTAINSGVTASDVSKARSAVQPSDLGNGTITITQGGETKGSFTTNQGNNTTIDIDAGGGSGLNVGDIFLTMRNDNELNGAVECDGATYNTTDFTGAQSIGRLLADGKVPYVSMAVYASTITTQGWCDKFGWDGTGNVQFKVPTLNAYIWQKLQAIIKGSVGSENSGGGGKYFVLNSATFTQFTNPGGGGYNVNVANNQTITGASADATNIVSQQRCMVQLATSASDEAVETCTGVLADVAALKYDYVVDFQAPTTANNNTWYRKYKSGWVEQGGIKEAGTTTINFPVAMANTDYWYIAKGNYNNPQGSYASSADCVLTKNTTNMVLSTGGLSVCWEVKGMAQG